MQHSQGYWGHELNLSVTAITNKMRTYSQVEVSLRAIQNILKQRKGCVLVWASESGAHVLPSPTHQSLLHQTHTEDTCIICM